MGQRNKFTISFQADYISCDLKIFPNFADLCESFIFTVNYVCSDNYLAQINSTIFDTKFMRESTPK